MMNKKEKIPRLIAHRGYARLYPENTLPALDAALKEGAWGVEFDVQMTRDLVPVVIHDPDLDRVTGGGGRVMDMALADLAPLRAHEPERFGDRFKDVKIPTLEETVSLLEKWPETVPFVEIKRESMMVHGHEPVVKAVMQTLAPVLDRSVVLSFDWEGARLAREEGARKIGWVIKTWNEESRIKAVELSPDFIVCNHEKLPLLPAGLWAGPWSWAFYEVVDPPLAMDLARRGADFIITMDIGKMAHDPLLCKRGSI